MSIDDNGKVMQAEKPVKLNKKQQRVITVLQRMIDMVKDDKDWADTFVDSLEWMLDEIAGEDGFGTERQMDPRGDCRDARWSMKKVEGVD